MGAWGILPFENDDAADFTTDLCDGSGMYAVITQALSDIPDDLAEYVQIPEAARAIAAAEVIAAMHGHDTGNVPDDLHDFMERYDEPDLLMMKWAIRAVARVLNDSELAGSWRDSDHASRWRDSIADLLRRLGISKE